MKVLIKYSSRIETVENVSVDDKCLPLVEGLHPYPSTASDESPLVRESALWFKTLAIEAVYIDCDRRLIYWAPVVNNSSTNGVVLRRSTTTTNTDNFITAMAKPLFKDSTEYDFNASLKEMMRKCTTAARKFFKKLQSVDEFHKVIAKILHMYILPSINFTADDMFCLMRAQCLIEMRLEKSEMQIANKADSIVNLRKCLNTLKSNILLRENLDDERYLRTCKKDFLADFLATIESDVDVLNMELSAQQSKVNWAKDHPDDTFNLSELQAKRDGLFQQIDKTIRVRESIKNVICRRELTKKKVKKCNVVDSCFHDVFVEIIRRLKLEDRILGHLGNDKVNICAAREAVVQTILEIANGSRNSDRVTKFEPEDFADFSVTEGQAEKSIVWLTFQERVARILENPVSLAYRIHTEGCRGLNSKINLAFSEFYLTKNKTHRLPQHHKPAAMEVVTNSPTSLNNVTMRNSKIGGQGTNRREAVLIGKEYESCVVFDLHKDEEAQPLATAATICEVDTRGNLFQRKALSTNDVRFSVLENPLEIVESYFGTNVNEPKSRRNISESSLDDMLADDYVSSVDEDRSFIQMHAHPLKRERHIMTERLAVSSLMNAVDNLKVQIATHLGEVIACLGKEFHNEDMDETSQVEQQELLWKSYERFFCQEVYGNLMELYVTGLTPSIRKAYTTLRKTPLNEILAEDKLLDLFFGEKETNGRGVSIPFPSSDQPEQISIARTVSSLSLDVRSCNINELYSLANADSNDLRRRFNLGSIEYDKENSKMASRGSIDSFDHSKDDKTFEMLSESQLSSARSTISSRYYDEEDFYQMEKLKIFSNAKKVEEILEPIMTPFQKLVRKCLAATCFLYKVRYITKATEGLNREISQMIGPDFQAACDDIISMLVLALYNLPKDMFVGLYINLRLLMDVLPEFLSGTLWDYNLVTLCASYDYLFTLKVCKQVVAQCPGSFRARR